MSQNDETLEYIQGFVDEGREMLSGAEESFNELENATASGHEVNHETVSKLFRMFHTFKGVSSFLNLSIITRIAADAEKLLETTRSGKRELSSEDTHLLTETRAFLLHSLDVLEKEASDLSLENDAKSFNEKYTNLQILDTTDEPPKKVLPKEESHHVNEEPIPSETFEERLDLDPELLKQFVIEGDELLNSIEEDLISFEQDTSDLEKFNSVFRNFHSFKGNCGFFGFKDLEMLCHKCETMFDYLRTNTRGFNPAINSNFLSVVSIIKEGLEGIKRGEYGEIPSVNALISILDDLFELIRSGNISSAKSEIFSQIVENLVEMISLDSQNEEDSEELGQNKTQKSNKGQTHSQSKTIRVDTEKLDVLLNLVGELVVSQSMIANSPDLLDIQDSLPVFSKRMDELKKICRDIQEASMSMRMLPIEPMFKKMIRLVRDVSIKSGKEVNLILKGGETEVDKNLIEHLSDPLIHILRNAVDHGIELPEERQRMGKPREGQLTLEATHANGEVWIRVYDDGQGLNRSKILAKAIEKGIASKEKNYEDSEIDDFIFHPGFSTADRVTNISGRGVGMDVVRTQIESMKGNINIISEPGKGSVFTLRIPLTMAILDGMIVSVDQQFYALPIASISESFLFNSEKIVRMADGTEMVRVREHYLKVFRLSEFYNTSNQEKSEGILMILSHDNNQICIFVDEIIGQQQIVLKPLPYFIGNVKCISGCAILSGGKLSMVLDARDLIHHAS